MQLRYKKIYERTSVQPCTIQPWRPTIQQRYPADDDECTGIREIFGSGGSYNNASQICCYRESITSSCVMLTYTHTSLKSIKMQRNKVGIIEYSSRPYNFLPLRLYTEVVYWTVVEVEVVYWTVDEVEVVYWTVLCYHPLPCFLVFAKSAILTSCNII